MTDPRDALDGRRRSRRPRLTPLATSAIFVAFGLTWILTSDRIVSFANDNGTLQTLKGSAFVLVTGGLIYWLTWAGQKGLRRSEAAAVARQSFLDELFRHLPGMVYVCRNDKDWTMEFASEGCREVTGYAPDDLVGNRTLAYNDLIVPDDRERVRDTVVQAVREDRPFQLRYRIRNAAGQACWVWEQGARSVQPGPDGSPADRLQGFIMDVTEVQERRDEMRQFQKMEIIAHLTSGIAHDFNNMLAVITSNAELLSISEDADEIADLAGEIGAAAGHGARMVRRLLGFARHTEPAFTAVDLRGLLHETEVFLADLLPDEIVVHVKPGRERRVVWADPSSVQQILLNLATNARDAMPGGGTLTVTLTATDLGRDVVEDASWVVPGRYACITVGDDGVGMDESTRARIFEPFYTTKPEGYGTGLGMPMVYGLMKEHRGYAHVYSRRGEGTTIKIYFPLAEAGTVAARRAAPARPVAGRSTGTVLVVEDEPSLQSAVRRVLEQDGYDVLEAADGEAALAMLTADPSQIAFVLSDIHMPRMGGLALLEACRNRGIDLPFVLASGNPVHDRAIPDRRARFIQKPWSIQDLRAAIRQVVDA